ncbi:MAG: type I-C CRISPR-associated protein Cas8c/Csd1 [Rhodocyclales bacterium]|nr:type I-C CRISPR-associated protein Cas8c/Csd1 [Rhodocyclales bacterium]
MILQALDAYYRRKQADPDPAKRLPPYGFEEKEIPFILEIAHDGTLVQISDTRSDSGKKKTATRFLVPQAVKKTSGVAANLLWDTAEYVLGVDTRGNPERVAQQHEAFRARIEALPEAVKTDPGVAAVRAFLARLDPDRLDERFASFPCWEEIKRINPYLSFRLHGDVELVCQRVAVTAVAGDVGEEETQEGVCLVRGEPADLARLHPPIKGLRYAQTSGANIVSFNLGAFNSWGKSQGANAPVGKPAAFAYTTALNHLLAEESRQHVQVGDTAIVFWAEEPHELEERLTDLFGEPVRDDPDRQTEAVRAIYEALQRGKFAVGEDDTRFYVLGLAPNAARIAIRFFESGTAMALAQRIRQHFEDISIVHGPNEPRYLSLFRLLVSLAVQHKADNIPSRLGGELIRAIFEGLPYPYGLLVLAVNRCRAEREVTYPRAALLRAILNRFARCSLSPTKEIAPMLDPDHPNPGYRLGRLFAVLERIQEEASPKLNATIRERYYGAASSTPAAVFPTLLRLATHHLAKLSEVKARWYERVIGEIMDGFDPSGFPPRILPLADQARFALGYYQQRQAFFTKTAKEPSEPTTALAEE